MISGGKHRTKVGLRERRIAGHVAGAGTPGRLDASIRTRRGSRAAPRRAPMATIPQPQPQEPEIPVPDPDDHPEREQPIEPNAGDTPAAAHAGGITAGK
jgi:hypothetical protein